MMQFLTSHGRRWGLVVGTMALALLSGHIMQLGQVDRRMPEPPETEIVLPQPPATAPTLRQPPRGQPRILETRAERLDTCDPELRVSETPTGYLEIAIDAPCHAGGPIRVQVNEMIADETTDVHGYWEARVPVLAETMQIEVVIKDIVLSEEIGPLPLTGHQHVIMTWQGARVFAIKAEASRTGVATDRGAEHALPEPNVTRLGDGKGSGLEIMTFPSAALGASGVVRLSVEAEVTADTCDQTIGTLAYQTGYLGTLRPTEIAFTMPDCDRIGEVVRLQNLFRDMRLAQR